MPVTTRIMNHFFLGNPNLNLHFHYYWEGGTTDNPRYHHGIMTTSWMILALKFREVSFAALNPADQLLLERFADTRTEREWKDGTEVRNKKNERQPRELVVFNLFLRN